MSRFLILDIGAGTMDVLYYDEAADLHYKAVVKSPVRHLAEKAQSLPGHLLVTGSEMGGGPITAVLRQRARQFEVVMSVSAAVTLHHNLDKVRSWGIRVVTDSAAEDLRHDKKYSPLTLGDLDIDRLKQIVSGLGVPFGFDTLGICVQDHGVPPEGLSHLDFRHNLFRAALDQNPYPHSLLFSADRVPEAMNRLKSAAESARKLPVEEIYVMDSGMAAILGASLDILARDKERILVLDVATSHTVGAAMTGAEIAGFFEYHTHDITLERLESLLCELADGNLEHKQILAEGGHGAYIRKSFGFEAAEIILATGPRRGLLKHSRLPIVYGAPWGDNMMTGTVGVLEAIRRHKGLSPMAYV